VAREMSAARQIVPGSKPGPGAAAVDAEATRWSALEAGAAENLSSDFKRAADANNAARLGYTDLVGHTPEVLAERLRLRGVESARDYGISDKVMTIVTPKAWDLLQRPHVRGVIQEARDLAALKGERFGTPPGARMEWSGRDIHWIKKALEGRANKKNADGTGLDPAIVGGINDVKSEFLKWAERPGNNPEYGVGRKNYQQHSRAAARMQFGQYLKDIMQKPLTKEYTAELRADALAAALKDPIKGNPHIAKATGSKEFEMYARDLLTPGEMKVFENILDDMARDKRVADQAGLAMKKHGSKIDTAATDWLPGPFHRPGVANALARLTMGNIDERIGKEISSSMRTVEGARNMLNEARTKRVDVRKRGNRIRKTASVATRHPAMYNALQNDQTQRD